MADILIKPDQHAVNERLTGAFRGRITFEWNQVTRILGAIEGMRERAPEGLAKGTNLAATRVRRDLIEAVKKASFLDPKRIESAITIGQIATKQSPTAKVRVIQRAEALRHFEYRQSESGAYARVYRGQGERYIKSGFVQTMPRGRVGVFTRKRIGSGNVRVGRYPIVERYGPSVRAIIKETPGLLDRETAKAQADLVNSISEVRNEIVDQVSQESSPLAMITGAAPVLGSYLTAATSFGQWAKVAGEIIGDIAAPATRILRL